MHNNNIHICLLCRVYSICSGSIGADAIKLPVLFTVCVKDIGSDRVSSYLGGD